MITKSEFPALDINEVRSHAEKELPEQSPGGTRLIGGPWTELLQLMESTGTSKVADLDEATVDRHHANTRAYITRADDLSAEKLSKLLKGSGDQPN